MKLNETQSEVPVWNTTEFQMAYLKAEMEGQNDWHEAQRLINRVLKDVVPDENLDVQEMLDRGDFHFDEAKGLTMLFYNEKPVALFGFRNGPKSEFIIEKPKQRVKRA